MVKKQGQSAASTSKLSLPASKNQISQNQDIQEAIYCEDNLTDKDSIKANQSSKRSLSPSKVIAKRKKQKKYNPDDRFLKEHQKNYYLFPFLYYTQNPFFKVSWGQWKPNSIYKQMAAALSKSPLIPGKTSLQCKSYDQRMKNENFVYPQPNKKKDLLQTSLVYLQKLVLERSDVEIIQNYVSKMGERSVYMTFLSEPGLMEEVQVEQVKLEEETKREESHSTENRECPSILFNEFFYEQ